MVTEECVTVLACIDKMNKLVQQLRGASRRLSTSELTSRWWGFDPEASPPLRAVAERLDACLAGFDALQRALGLPADIEPRYGRLLDEVRAVGRDSRSSTAPEKGAA
jgi:hypothetical protein